MGYHQLTLNDKNLPRYLQICYCLLSYDLIIFSYIYIYYCTNCTAIRSLKLFNSTFVSCPIPFPPVDILSFAVTSFTLRRLYLDACEHDLYILLWKLRINL